MTSPKGNPMDNEIREMRELLIELRINLQHLNTRVDTTLNQLRDQVSRLEERVHANERFHWIAVGAIGIISFIAPYIVDWLNK